MKSVFRAPVLVLIILFESISSYKKSTLKGQMDLKMIAFRISSLKTEKTSENSVLKGHWSLKKKNENPGFKIRKASEKSS